MVLSFTEKKKANEYIGEQATSEMVRGDSWVIDRKSVTEYFTVS